MMFYGHERGKAFWIKRAVFIPIAIAAGVFVFGSVVMLLWNALLPAVFGFKVITFWQALGLLVLSKILFGGFGGGHSHRMWHNHPNYHSGRWMHLTAEEREKMRSEWRGRCEPQAKQE